MNEEMGYYEEEVRFGIRAAIESGLLMNMNRNSFNMAIICTHVRKYRRRNRDVLQHTKNTKFQIKVTINYYHYVGFKDSMNEIGPRNGQ